MMERAHTHIETKAPLVRKLTQQLVNQVYVCEQHASAAVPLQLQLVQHLPAHVCAWGENFTPTTSKAGSSRRHAERQRRALHCTAKVLQRICMTGQAKAGTQQMPPRLGESKCWLRGWRTR